MGCGSRVGYQDVLANDGAAGEKRSSADMNWTGLDEDEDAHVWEDNWDDDNVEDDFSNQLRAELEKHGYKMETS
ncbi:PREDICTED: 26S proteasome complex subunit DSS1 [Chaetura pelagica]|uniref:26S proteasome complex subunit DSS1 n=1 Tax=Chaetura pelagica TaxID=8897 RepID=UPI00052310D7|nr:PREDICTED: 26S proteasome complex subunit DSS1 [Chaetura pelagica]